MSSAFESRVVEGRLAIRRGETLEQGRIWAELLRPTVKLALLAQNNSAAFGKGMDGPTNLDLMAAQRLQFADLFAVLAETDNREVAGSVGSLRAANVEKPRPIGEFDHVIDVSANADILIQTPPGLLNIETWLRSRPPREIEDTPLPTTASQRNATWRIPVPSLSVF